MRTRALSRPLAVALSALAAAALVSCGGSNGPSVPPDPTFTITLRYDSSVDALSQSVRDQFKADFENAKARIEEVITAGLVPVNVNLDCDSVRINEQVHNLIILVSAVDMGASGTLAQSGPCIVRSRSKLPLVAVMRFNTQYIETYENTGQLPIVVLHEMFHTLGFGTQWPDFNGLVSGPLSNPVFKNASTLTAAKTKNSAPTAWTSIPVENCGPGAPIDCSPTYDPNCCQGTRDSHWRETVFHNELMTGWVTNETTPMSAMTIASLGALGYSVNVDKADPFTVPTGSALLGPPLALVHYGDDVIHTPPAVAEEP